MPRRIIPHGSYQEIQEGIGMQPISSMLLAIIRKNLTIQELDS